LHNEAHTILVREALQELALQGYCAWPVNTGATKTDSGGFIKFGKKGGADISAIIPIPVKSAGRTFGIHAEFEAKTGNAVQRKNQKLHQEFVVERNGGIYIVFRATDGSEEAIKKGVSNLLEAIKMAVKPYQI